MLNKIARKIAVGTIKVLKKPITTILYYLFKVFETIYNNKLIIFYKLFYLIIMISLLSEVLKHKSQLKS